MDNIIDIVDNDEVILVPGMAAGAACHTVPRQWSFNAYGGGDSGEPKPPPYAAAIFVPCPTCGALPGEFCSVWMDGEVREVPHKTRTGR